MSGSAATRIDWRQVRALVRAFVLMSVRKMPMRTLRGERKAGGLGPLVMLFVLYTLFGALMAAMFAVTKDVFLSAFTAHMMTLFVVGTAAMSEASDVLFSTSENDVLGHRPIPPQTLVLAKALTILAFTGMLAGAMNLVPTIVLFFMDDARPLAPLAHIASVALSTIFASAAVVCLYGVVARVLGRERLQRAVTGAQIASTIFLAAGFQVVPRLLDTRNGIDLGALLHDSWTVWLIPPAWFAGIDGWLGSAVSEPRFEQLALVGLGVTLVCAWLGVLRLPTANESVASLQEEAREERPPPRSAVAGRASLVQRMLGPWLRDPVERASFALAHAYLARERGVKVRLASALGFYLVFPVIAIFDHQRSSFLPLMMIWMGALLPITVLETLRITTRPEAADLFLYAPIEGGARIFHGVRKAAIVFVQLPILCYTILVACWAMRAAPTQLLLLLPALVAMPLLSLVPGLTGEYLPLSVASRTGQRTLQSMIVFLVMIPAAIFGGLSYFALRAGWFWPLFALEVPLVIAGHVALRGIVARRSRRLGHAREGVGA
ncbi:MAG: hypothetical protein IPJ19_18580 [Planctomycetes bacterium]|nr:hypothetical protein [Planctomycetota bacterium]